MTDILNHPQAYIPGELEITRQDAAYSGRCTLAGNFNVSKNIATDHLQLIYEALEIAAHSDDKFAPQFRAMCDELMALTQDWDQ